MQTMQYMRVRCWWQVCLLLAVVTGGLMLAGCAGTSQTRVAVANEDLVAFTKSFEGSLVNKVIEEFNREEKTFGLWRSNKAGVYVQFTVMDANGTTRKFFDFSEEPDRMAVLRQFYRELQKGDIVVIDMGLVDEESAEETFETVSKK
jgi:hypothetical protein